MHNPHHLDCIPSRPTSFPSVLPCRRLSAPLLDCFDGCSRVAVPFQHRPPPGGDPGFRLCSFNTASLFAEFTNLAPLAPLPCTCAEQVPCDNASHSARAESNAQHEPVQQDDGLAFVTTGATVVSSPNKPHHGQPPCSNSNRRVVAPSHACCHSHVSLSNTAAPSANGVMGPGPAVTMFGVDHFNGSGGEAASATIAAAAQAKRDIAAAVAVATSARHTAVNISSRCCIFPGCSTTSTHHVSPEFVAEGNRVGKHLLQVCEPHYRRLLRHFDGQHAKCATRVAAKCLKLLEAFEAGGHWLFKTYIPHRAKRGGPLLLDLDKLEAARLSAHRAAEPSTAGASVAESVPSTQTGYPRKRKRASAPDSSLDSNPSRRARLASGEKRVLRQQHVVSARVTVSVTPRGRQAVPRIRVRARKTNTATRASCLAPAPLPPQGAGLVLPVIVTDAVAASRRATRPYQSSASKPVLPVPLPPRSGSLPPDVPTPPAAFVMSRRSTSGLSLSALDNLPDPASGLVGEREHSFEIWGCPAAGKIRGRSSSISRLFSCDSLGTDAGFCSLSSPGLEPTEAPRLFSHSFALPSAAERASGLHPVTVVDNDADSIVDIM